MSVVAGELVTEEEEVDDLAEDSLCSSYASDIEKKTRKKKVSGRPPPSPKSPYQNSANLHQKRAPVASWRTVREKQLHNCKTPPAGPLRDVWLHLQDDGHGSLSKSPKVVDYSVTPSNISSARTPEYLKEALGMKKPKYSRSASNGYVPGTPDYKEKEEMYDEIIDLKKTLQSQKAESDKMKAKLRRLEEENIKKDRQIEQLLDPAKDPEYARSLVDRKTDPRSIISGLKQRILRLEQQCKEKENALSQLQSDLKTTNMQEMKITVETYFEEVQRLRALLESFERSNRAESKDSRRQNKTLSATVLKLTKTVQQLEDENQELKKELTHEEMSMKDSPACRAKGYLDWSKQRLVRRILELEKRVEKMKNLQMPKASDPQKNQGDKDKESTDRSDSINTEVELSIITENGLLNGVIKKLEEQKKELQLKLSQKDEEIKQLFADKDERLKEVENVLKEQIRDHERLVKTHRQEMSTLIVEMGCLKEKLDEEKNLRLVQDPNQVLGVRSLSSTIMEEEKNLRLVQDPNQVQDGSSSSTLTEPLSSSSEIRNMKTRNKAAEIIQKEWRSHSKRDLVLLQSCLRGHLNRQRHLDGQKQVHPETVLGAMSQSDLRTPAAQEEEVTLLQSVFRAHLKRSTMRMDRASAVTQSVSSIHPKKQYPLARGSSQTLLTNKTQTSEVKIQQQEPAAENPKSVDSDDSDDIIVSPSRPLRKREQCLNEFSADDLI